MEKMRAVVQHAAFDFRVELVDKPVPGPLEAVIKIEASGICAGDRIMYEGKAPWGIHDGEIPGHEYVGIITQTGEGFAEKYGLDVGDRCLAEAGLVVRGRQDVKPVHAKAADAQDALHAARAAEVTSLWRLAAA